MKGIKERRSLHLTHYTSSFTQNFMRLNYVIWLIIIVLIGCGENTAEIEAERIARPPLTPQMHLHRRDLPDDQWGPDVLTENNGIHIEWEPNIEDDLQGYRIYLSTSPTGGFKRIDEVSPENTFYENAGVKLETTFCYRVTAVDDGNNESTPPNQAILDAVPTFRWIGVNESGFYTVRIFVIGAEDSEPPLQETWHHAIVDFDVFEVLYNTDGTVTQALTAGQEYRWRVDFGAEATVGAESNWRFFGSGHNKTKGFLEDIIYKLQQEWTASPSLTT